MFRILKTIDWFPADGFPITVERREPQEQFPRHKHEFSEIVIVTGGKGLHVVGSESWPLATGDVFVVGGPLTHEYRDLSQLSLINILFQADKLQLEPADLVQLPGYHALFGLESAWRDRHHFKNRLHLPPRNLARLMGLVDQLDEELRVRSHGFAFVATAVFMQIVGYLSRCYSHQDLKTSDTRSLPGIAQALSHLESNPSQPVSLNELASLAHMSKRSFIRTFREATGVTPIAYGIQVRVNRAAALLRSGGDSITEVAFRAGFSDSNYFTRQFRKLMGISPRHYRQQHSAAAQRTSLLDDR